MKDQLSNKIQCWDCQKYLEPEEEYMPYAGGLCKCKKCHQADPVLRNFQECEVYSRVVGYIRPVKQWNKGKQEEFKDRKVYVHI